MEPVVSPFRISAVLRRIRPSTMTLTERPAPRLQLDKRNMDSVVSRAVEVLQDGGVIAIPTDTIYGIACLADRSQSVRRLYNVKTRPDNKPIAVCLSKPQDFAEWVKVDHLPQGLLEHILPGPVTLVLELPENSLLKPGQPGLKKLGIRVPANEFCLSLSAAIPGRIPLALTSSNSSGDPSCLNVNEFAHLWPRLDLVVDGGPIAAVPDNSKRQRFGSTVIDLSIPGGFSIIRRGINAEKYVDLLEKNYGLIWNEPAQT